MIFRQIGIIVIQSDSRRFDIFKYDIDIKTKMCQIFVHNIRTNQNVIKRK